MQFSPQDSPRAFVAPTLHFTEAVEISVLRAPQESELLTERSRYFVLDELAYPRTDERPV
jgi:hypothetical protein